MPLKKAEVAKFKKRLEDLRLQITQSLKGTSQEVKSPDEGTGYSQHQADQGTDDFDRTISLEVTTREYNILKQIDRALEKIEEGTYGICDLTNKEIPIARLEAIPWANMTRDAQEQLEKGQI
jgi:DnaK suppressor protein